MVFSLFGMCKRGRNSNESQAQTQTQPTADGDEAVAIRLASEISDLSEQEVPDLTHTAAYKAVEDRNYEELIRILQGPEGPMIGRARSSVTGRSLLHVWSRVVTSLTPELAGKIIDACERVGIELNCCDNSGNSPLFYSVLTADSVITRALIAKGATVNMINNCGETPLHMACFQHEEKILKLLLEANARADVTDNQGNTLIHTCCHNGRDSYMRLLKAHGANPFQCNSAGVSPLMIASRNFRYNCIELLLEWGVEIDECNYDGWNAARYALTPRHYKPNSSDPDDVLMKLIRRGIDIHSVAIDGISPLSILKEKCSPREVQIFEDAWERAEKPTGLLLK